MKISEAVEVFVDAKLADGLSLATVRWYQNRLRRLAEYLKDSTIEQVSTIDLRRFIVALRNQDKLYQNHPSRREIEGTLSPATRQGYVRAIRQFFHWLQVEGCIAENPTKHIKLPPLGKAQPRAITEKALKALLKAAEGDDPANKRDRALLLFLADTGCRVGGLVGLKVSDLDLNEGMATVTEKGSKSRSVLFMPTTAQAVREYLQVRPVISEWVFPNMQTGEKMDPTSVNHIICRLKEKAGDIEGCCNPHAFRHAFAREYILNGGDLATLAEILGHTDIGVTKRFYSNFQFKELQEKHRRFSPVAGLELDSSKEGRF